MKKVTDLLFSRVFADPQLRVFFDGISEATLRHKQETMMEMLFGGTVRMRRVVAGLGHLGQSNLRDKVLL
jgi:hypothetical protein